jgi:membrane-associated phospholipid phosphatase
LVLNQALNHVLKTAVAAPRPQPSIHPAFDALSPHGFPSDHCQFMGFLCAFAFLWAPSRWRAPVQLRSIAMVLVAFATAGVAASRVALRYHSRGQAAAGLAIGGCTGAAWHWAVEALLRPRFAGVAASAWGRWAMVRDCSSVNVLLEEYAAVAAAAARAPSGGGSGGGGRGGAAAGFSEEGKFV